MNYSKQTYEKTPLSITCMETLPMPYQFILVFNRNYTLPILTKIGIHWYDMGKVSIQVHFKVGFFFYAGLFSEL
jgi:hypothetical protein